MIFRTDIEHQDIRVCHLTNHLLNSIFSEKFKWDFEIGHNMPEGKIEKINHSASLRVEDIVSAYYISIRSESARTKTIRRMAKKVGVNTKNSYFDFKYDDKFNIIDYNFAISNEDFLKEGKNTSKIINKDEKSPNCAEYRSNILFDFEMLKEECEYYKQLTEKETLTNFELYYLYTNFKDIVGGTQKVNELIKTKKNKEVLDKLLVTFKKCKTSSASCGACPYKENCKNCTDNIKTLAVAKKGQIAKFYNRLPNIISLEEAREQIYDKFYECLNADEDFAYLKSPTGSGKTHNLITVLLENEQKTEEDRRRYIISFGTHRLKNEFAECCKRRGYDNYLVQPEIPHGHMTDEQERVLEQMYSKGLHRKVYSYLKGLGVAGIDDYLRENEKISEDKIRTLLITHDKMLYSRFENEDVLIIDEDIFQKVFDMNMIKEIDLLNFQKRVKLYIEKQKDSLKNNVYEKIVKINQEIASSGRLKIAKPINPVSKEGKVMEEFIQVCTDGIEANLMAFYSSVVHTKTILNQFKKEQELVICYLVHRDLPKTYNKIINMSATFDKDIVDYISDSNYFAEVDEIKYKGKITQVPYYSNSITSLSQEKRIVVLKSLVDLYKPENPVLLTFKGCLIDFEGVERIDDVYYFNSVGYNSLKGRNIVQVGGPGLNPIYYNMVAYFIMCKKGVFSSKYEHIVYDQVHQILVERKGMRYYQYLYAPSSNEQLDIEVTSEAENEFIELLRNLQLYIKESEVTQLAGRSRLVESESEILILTDTPITAQAKIIHLTSYDFKKIKEHSRLNYPEYMEVLEEELEQELEQETTYNVQEDTIENLLAHVS